MNMQFPKQRNRAVTLVELLVVVGAIAFLAAILLPVNEPNKRAAQRINCISNLKQINSAFRVWSPPSQDDNFPMSISVTNGGAMEMLAAGNVAGCFQVMSNELSSPKVLICPADIEHAVAATNFQNDFNNSHVSYFLNPDASEVYPQQIMIGDANLAINGVAVKSGLLDFSTNAPISWTAARHHYVGNIGYADGSVAEVSDAGLQASLILDTNGTPTKIVRLAIP